jgi:Family of unknown function (DUF5335)
MIRDVPSAHWREELDRFNERHQGWLVSVATRDSDGQMRIEARDLPLQGVTQATTRANELAIEVGDSTRHLTHQVRNVTAIRLDRADEEAVDRALIIDSEDRTSTTVTFLQPRQADDTSGLSTDRRD